MKVAFIHPDLGLGGAERLVVDAAVGLQSLGHNVEIITSHHDPSRCFEETRDGTIKIRVLGDNLFPTSVRGKLTLWCAIARQLHLVLSLAISSWGHSLRRNRTQAYDIYFIDQLSASMPLLRWLTNTRAVFYCHFPDLLLSPNIHDPTKRTMLRKLYRVPLDYIEQYTTNEADAILVNSQFTANVFRNTFPSIQKDLQILYPAIQIKDFLPHVNVDGSSSFEIDTLLSGCQGYFLSINRFEKKKNLSLAIESFAFALNYLSKGDRSLKLVIAGGYDSRLPNNMETYRELKTLAATHDLTFAEMDSPDTHSASVLFLPNLSRTQKLALLQSKKAISLLYTPSGEHFGIVPLEAMASGLPVLACNDGGPLETIVDKGIHTEESTGLLRKPHSQEWGSAMLDLIGNEGARRKMGQAGQRRVRDHFSVDRMAITLQDILQEQVNSRETQPIKEDGFIKAVAIFFMALVGTSLFITVSLFGHEVQRPESILGRVS